MKKIAITLAAIAAFAAAGCTSSDDTAANNVTDIEATDNEANLDANAAAIDAAGNAIEDLGNAADNATAELGNVAENATQ